jgi:hypothetical protein
MGIEPTREARSELENMRFGAMADAKCDGRVNFRGMWGHVGYIGEPFYDLRSQLLPMRRAQNRLGFILRSRGNWRGV